MAKKPRIALGMSGGVDSAVSAALLRDAGYEVVGVTCVFHDGGAARSGLAAPGVSGAAATATGDGAAFATGETAASALGDTAATATGDVAATATGDAKAVCDLLGIEHVVVDCTAEFEETVVSPFVRAYESGQTPSPCVGCNAGCKIPSLLRCADDLGCESVATGHYARIARLVENGRFMVATALDATKDQSYMLALLSQEQLARLVLPLGAATKVEVRILAGDLGLPVANKPESQDICFIDGSYEDFLASRGVADRPGAIVNAAGEVLGRHEGLFRYTLGQRKGICVAASKPYYVIAKREAENELVIGFQSEAMLSEVRLDSVNWMAFECLERPLDCMVKLRYRSRLAPCTVEPQAGDGGHGAVRVRLKTPQPITAPGQFAVFYLGDTLLGGGMICG
ncbi:MAG: tRNA 2-thiouridine(34) synthase MnmA [Eggerthellaceae bacterium]|nr:tRNA 2-thiouridine(34) synthase MnmA [Eggerthellaceae bacterium]